MNIPEYQVGDEVEVTYKGKISYISQYVKNFVRIGDNMAQDCISLDHPTITAISVTRALPEDRYTVGTMIKKIYAGQNLVFDIYRKMARDRKWHHMVDQIGGTYPYVTREWSDLAKPSSGKWEIYILIPGEANWKLLDR